MTEFLHKPMAQWNLVDFSLFLMIFFGVAFFVFKIFIEKKPR